MIEDYVAEHSSGGSGNVDEEDVREIVDEYITEEYLEGVVKEYVEEHNGAIVYLNTKQCIGRNIELQDVYPI
jgi:hypothetical protein